VPLLGFAHVVRVAHVLIPLGTALADGEVGHEVAGRGAVPVPFAPGGDDDVAGVDGQDRPAAELSTALAFGDVVQGQSNALMARRWSMAR
jgi:hypothetical protein